MEDQAKKNNDSQYTPTVSSPNKEVPSSFVEHSEKGPTITNDVKQYIAPSEPNVPQHEQVGIKPSAESVPVNTEPTGVVSLPMTEDEVNEVLKNKSSNFNLQEQVDGEYTEDAKPFLATLIRKILDVRRIFGFKGV